MPDLPDFETLRLIGRDEALVRNARLALDAFEREGADANVLNAAAAAMVDDLVGDVAVVLQGMYLDGAAGDALKRLVFDRYQILAKPAAPAGVDLSFETTIATTAPFVIDSATTVRTSDGTKFRPSENVVFPAASTGPVVVRALSILSGADQQVRADTVTQIDTPPVGAPTDLTVTNPLASSGAADAESDTSLRRRGKLFWAAARRGTVGALEFGALTTAGVDTATAFEVLDALGRPAKITQIIVTDIFTISLAELDTEPATYAVQSAALADLVQAALQEYRAGGMPVEVYVAETIIQPIVLALGFRAGADTVAATLGARSAAVTHTNTLSPGVAFLPDAVLEAVIGVPGIDSSTTTLITPSGPVTPTPLQVIRTSLETVRAVV